MQELEARVSDLETQLAAAQTALETVLPWIGVDDQLRVRLERSEQAIFALIQEPGNPFASAELARNILTSIPVPQG